MVQPMYYTCHSVLPEGISVVICKANFFGRVQEDNRSGVLECKPLGWMPSREKLDYVLRYMAGNGIDGYFYVLAAKDNLLTYTKADSPQQLAREQQHVGWHGLFTSKTMPSPKLEDAVGINLTLLK